jgi:hypothetical protein
MTITYAYPVAGVCGSANGQALNTAPTANLCAAGTPSSVTGSGPWTWTCYGTDGGGDQSCSANIQSYVLTVNKVGNGIGSVVPNTGAISWNGATGTVTYIYGTPITLTATAGPGSIFTGWSGACTGTGSCVVNMSANQSVSATFVPDITPVLMLILSD